MEQVVLFGTFDGLHPGHRALLEEAARWGELTVILPTDQEVEEFKGREVQFNWEKRRTALLETGLVKTVVEGDSVRGTYQALLGVKPSLVVFGYDQEALRDNWLEWCAQTGYSCQYKTLTAFCSDKYKSSLLRPKYD